MLKCKQCKQSLPHESYHKDRSRKTGYSNRCKPCETLRAHPRIDGRIELIRQAKSKPCADCGVTHPLHVMDLDHRPGREKLFELSRAAYKSKEAILVELAKCDAVCANCHRERTHRRGYVSGS